MYNTFGSFLVLLGAERDGLEGEHDRKDGEEERTGDGDVSLLDSCSAILARLRGSPVNLLPGGQRGEFDPRLRGEVDKGGVGERWGMLRGFITGAEDDAS